ncbi:MAG: L-threonylcarbamoyladenylate synthase [Pseudomonadota bacterium]|nr:L-threonylcarbamoyladenylate synthase [Pseudomonadota bacterium]
MRINPGKTIAEAELDKAVGLIAAGGVVAFPTETFYGLAADAANEEAIARIFSIKGRDFRHPIALIIADPSDLEALTDEVSDAARILMAAFWPGPLTLLLRAAPRVSLHLTAGGGKIGVRISSHPVAQALASGLGRPITATSANLSGHPECATAEEVRKQFPSASLAILDGGPTPGGKGSTILDTTVAPPLVLREGMISKAAIADILRGGKPAPGSRPTGPRTDGGL